MSQYAYIPLLPLLGSLTAGLLGRLIGVRLSQLATILCMIGASLLAIQAFWQVAVQGGPVIHEVLFKWIISGDFAVNFAIYIDKITAVMLVVVAPIATLIHIYSIGYMEEDPHNPRFFSYLSLFTFAMLMLVLGDNFLQLFFGWEGVGLASYLLIGFWFKKESACNAAIKAFLVNRVGDFGFALGIFTIFMVFGTLDYAEVFQMAQAGQYPQTIDFIWGQVPTITAICLMLFIGAMGKSAQLGLHTWLPDAMEGPTPVSALIHAATMVTAGVFMVCRASPLFELSDTALAVVTLVGAGTAFMAATIGMVQNDIKKVIAYSTCSQLGYMFFGAGVSAYAASMFHLMTHAFFKALLFLGAGAVIMAMHHEQDMRKMGGLAKKIPITYTLMMVGTLALTGFPGLAGYFSKDAILESAYAAHTPTGMLAFTMGIMAAFMTTFYSFRLVFMTFHGTPHDQKAGADHGHGEDHGHAHAAAAHAAAAHDDHGHGGHGSHEVREPSWFVRFPNMVLAIGAVLAGWVGSPLVHEGWFGAAMPLAEGHDALANAHHVPFVVKWLPFGMFLAGLTLAWLLYVKNPGTPARIAARLSSLYNFLLNAWYFDKLYDKIFVQPAKCIGDGLWKTGDATIIDKYLVEGVGAAVLRIAQWFRGMQTGYIYHYAFAMLIGVMVLVTFYV
ncbi:MAG: NADH-quinone oxidoreductase subunit L [Magnetococcales bacterium]|nr:NADH-quinone oxidoreductase subunit L [Magnetococcales bacterium]